MWSLRHFQAPARWSKRWQLPGDPVALVPAESNGGWLTADDLVLAVLRLEELPFDAAVFLPGMPRPDARVGFNASGVMARWLSDGLEADLVPEPIGAHNEGRPLLTSV